ncbi:hypothetical protein DRP07_09870 [Archaeoglobales archaeon]|nr:MAG: hypothetical protein DRP07_09870 [Archaeoglobales archaeon]
MVGNLRILVSATDYRVGKTSFIYVISQVLGIRFRYEKPSGMSELEKKFIESDEGETLTFIEGGKKYKIGLTKNEGDTSIEVDKTILIARYVEDVFDEITLASRVLSNIKAIIINEIPENEMENIREGVDKSDLNIVGLIPYDKFLGGTYIKSVRDYLDGVFLTKPDENFIMEEMLVGAMSPSCAIRWLEKVKNAGLVTGGDRVDLQKLALDTGIKCLILTGNFEPPQIIVKRAEELGVCIILTESDTLTAVEKISQIMREEISEQKKDKLVEIFKRNIDLEKLEEILKY